MAVTQFATGKLQHQKEFRFYPQKKTLIEI